MEGEGDFEPALTELAGWWGQDQLCPWGPSEE